jgi:hypothetical protein
MDERPSYCKNEYRVHMRGPLDAIRTDQVGSLLVPSLGNAITERR